MVNEAHDNVGVIVVDDKQDGDGLANHPMMLENYKERMADVVAMLDKQKEVRAKGLAEGKRADQIDAEARKVVNQTALDEVFTAFMDKEYKDEQIGDLEG